MEADNILQDPIAPVADVQLSIPIDEPEPSTPAISPVTLKLADRNVRMVLDIQRDQSQTLTTKLNLLFVANGALLTSLSISRLIVSGSVFSVAEVLGFLICFSLLMGAFLPRQVAVTPNLEDREFLETYLALPDYEYQLQMLVNLQETYNANQQRLDDISQSLKYPAYSIWGTAGIASILPGSRGIKRASPCQIIPIHLRLWMLPLTKMSSSFP